MWFGLCFFPNKIYIIFLLSMFLIYLFTYLLFVQYKFCLLVVAEKQTKYTSADPDLKNLGSV